MPDSLIFTDEELDNLVEKVPDPPAAQEPEPRFRTRAELRTQFPRQSRTTLCPSCAQPLALRDGARGLFYGCQRFPYCRGTVNANQETGMPSVTAYTYGGPQAAQVQRVEPEWFVFNEEPNRTLESVRAAKTRVKNPRPNLNESRPASTSSTRTS
jgi:ssDNA-binding Zn-finger/Zn-ribbon topoisomerase 1